MSATDAHSPPVEDKWTRAQSLAVAGALAPHLRDQEGRASRRVARVDARGNVVGYTTLGEVQKALLRRQEIEFDVADGVRPKEIICETCGCVDKVGAKGAVPKCCARCRSPRCANCAIELPPSAGTPWAHRKRRGKPARCRGCAVEAVASAPVAMCADCGALLGKHAMRPSAVAKRQGATPRCKPCNGKRLRLGKNTLSTEQLKARAKTIWTHRRASGEVRKVHRCPACDVEISRSAVQRATAHQRVAHCIPCASKAMDRTALAKKAWRTKRAARGIVGAAAE